jgi:hypothetical protein
MRRNHRAAQRQVERDFTGVQVSPSAFPVIELVFSVAHRFVYFFTDIMIVVSQDPFEDKRKAIRGRSLEYNPSRQRAYNEP